VIQAVPLTSTVRSFRSEVQIEAHGANGLEVRSAAQCQHVRGVSTGRVGSVRGNMGPMVLSQVREALALIVDLPA
jgi:mRNA interferase MazF